MSVAHKATSLVNTDISFIGLVPEYLIKNDERPKASNNSKMSAVVYFALIGRIPIFY